MVINVLGNLFNDIIYRLILRYVYIKYFKYVRGNLFYIYLIMVIW